MWMCFVLSIISLRPTFAFISDYSYPPLEGLSLEPVLTGDQQLPDNFVHSKIYSAFDDYNKELEFYNRVGALIAWNISLNMTPQILGMCISYKYI